MNFSAVIMFLVVVFLSAAFGVPVGEYDKDDRTLTQDPETELEVTSFSPEQDEEENLGLRFRRVTCDLLSISIPFGSLNHAACAAHCLVKRKGFKGGRCKNGVCHCRK